MKGNSKTYKFSTPEQLAELNSIRQEGKRIETIKADLQAQMDRAMEAHNMRVESHLRNLEVLTDAPAGSLDSYELDMMYMDEHNIAFAYQKHGPQMPPGLAALLGQFGGDAPDNSDPTPTAH